MVCVVGRGGREKKMCQQYPLVLPFSPKFSVTVLSFAQVLYFKCLPSWDGGIRVLGFGRMGLTKSEFPAATEL